MRNKPTLNGQAHLQVYEMPYRYASFSAVIDEREAIGSPFNVVPFPTLPTHLSPSTGWSMIPRICSIDMSNHENLVTGNNLLTQFQNISSHTYQANLLSLNIQIAQRNSGAKEFRLSRNFKHSNRYSGITERIHFSFVKHHNHLPAPLCELGQLVSRTEASLEHREDSVAVSDHRFRTHHEDWSTCTESVTTEGVIVTFTPSWVRILVSQTSNSMTMSSKKSRWIDIIHKPLPSPVIKLFVPSIGSSTHTYSVLSSGMCSPPSSPYLHSNFTSNHAFFTDFILNS